MSTTQQPEPPNASDALIDEVRSIRRAVYGEFGNDVERLCAHRQEVERDYAARRGVFATVSKEAAAKVVKSWGSDPLRTDDPLLDEVRALRKALGEKGQ
jgi:hypothetical protein